MAFLRAYGAAGTIDGVPLITRGAMDYKANPTLATGDVQISKDGGAFANITTLPAVTPSGGTSVLVNLSATETQAKHIIVRFIDQTATKEWEDQEIIVETFGHASAQFTGDLNNLDAAISSRANGADYTSARAVKLDNLDATVASRLAASGYTAPDNAGIDFIEKWINNKLIESPPGTWKLYDDDGVTVLKTWTWDSGTSTRSKAT